MALTAGGCSINPPLRLDRIVAEPHIELAGVPFHPQQAHHCGPASLLTVLEASGVELDYAAVEERVYVPGLQGSLQPEMSSTTRHFGRIAYALPPEPEVLLAEVAAGRPILVLLNLGLPARPYWHYAVVVGYDAKRNRVVLRSGTERRLVVPARRWLRQWDWAGRWALLALPPSEWPAAPSRTRLLQALADFESAGSPTAAARAWQMAVEHWPSELAAWLGLGNAAHAVADWSEAERAYRRALGLDPDYWPARINLAATLESAGRACDGLEVLGGASPPAGDPLHSMFREVDLSLGEACARSIGNR